jgi:hypothetical protein
LYSAKAKIACKRCNNEFLSGFDRLASLLLKPMLNGKLSLRPGGAAQLILARWAMKMTLLIPIFVVPKLDLQNLPPMYHEFRQDGMPLGKRVNLFIGQYVGDVDPLAWVNWRFLPAPSDARVPPGTQFQNFGITFCIKNLVFHAHGIVQPLIEVVTFPRGVPSDLLPLWPTTNGFVWPPAKNLTDARLFGLSRAVINSPPLRGVRR